MTTRWTALALALALLPLAACGDSGGDGSPEGGTPGSEAPSPDAGAAAGLSAEELEKGIGPIRSVDLGATVDEGLAEEGAAVFRTKCYACHRMSDRYVGPPLGDVVERRAPEFVMNMILNPAEMVERHPEGKAMLAQFLTPMPNQNLTPEQARAVLEYLRSENRKLSATD